MQHLVPIALSSQLDVTGEEKIHASPYVAPVRAAWVPNPIVLEGDVPSGPLGGAVNYTYTVSGGALPRVVSIIAGSLPPGTDIDQELNVVGTYTIAGFYSWTVQVEDAYGSTETVDDTAGVINITGDPPLGGTGSPYSYTLTGEGGVLPHVFTLESGSLPDGLGLASDGEISGTPTTIEVQQFDVRITDAESNTIVGTFEIEITSYEIIGDLPDGAIDDAVSGAYTQIGGTEPVVYTVDSGTFPPGVTLNPDGTYSGTFTAAGSYSWVIRGEDDLSVVDTLADTCDVSSTLLLSVGDGGAIASSVYPDASVWDDETSGVTNNLNEVVLGVAAHVIVGSKTGSGIILRSIDGGASWTSITTNVTCTHLQGVATNSAGIVIAVGNSGGVADGKITRSTDDGATFAAVTAPSGCGPLTCVATDGNGRWVAGSTSGKVIVSNDDGVTWTKYTVGTNNIYGVCWNEEVGLWMAAGEDGSAYISTTGVTWINQGSVIPGNGAFRAVTSIGTRFIAVTHGTSASYAGIWVSLDDGDTWTRIQATAYNFAVCTINGKVYSGDVTGTVWVSDDQGDTWTGHSSILGHSCNGIAGGLVPP